MVWTLLINGLDDAPKRRVGFGNLTLINANSKNWYLNLTQSLIRITLETASGMRKERRVTMIDCGKRCNNESGNWQPKEKRPTCGNFHHSTELSQQQKTILSKNLHYFAHNARLVLIFLHCFKVFLAVQLWSISFCRQYEKRRWIEGKFANKTVGVSEKIRLKTVSCKMLNS